MSRWPALTPALLAAVAIASFTAVSGTASAAAGGAAKVFDAITSRPVSVAGETFGSTTVKAVEPAAHDTVLWAGAGRNLIVDDEVPAST